MSKRPKARAFGQDLAGGEHVFKPGDATRRDGSDPRKVNGGVLMPSHTSGDPKFYATKRATEQALGRTLTTDEFLADHYVPDDAATAMGTSIFDPVLTELAYRWFCPPRGLILDPFAGGSVRGIVAGMLGRQYIGVDLRPEQVVANRIQAELIFDGRDLPKPQWAVGDARDALSDDLGEATVEFGCAMILAGADKFDMIFSCPPYADLEVYSDDPRDLSTMDYETFLAAYAEIVRLACARLRDDRFACFVVGDVRGPDGCYRSFPQHTIEAFEAAGLRLYNDAILVTAAGSLPIRARRQFETSRKLGGTHQRVLVFLKGDSKAAVAAIGPVEFGDFGGADQEAEVGDDQATADETAAAQGPPRQGPRVAERAAPPDDPGEATPTHRVHFVRHDGPGGGDVWLKRDDLFTFAGVSGGKVRSCRSIVENAGKPLGLVTAGSRSSPQVNIVAHIGRELGIPVRAHVPSGALGPEVEAAQRAGAEIIQHKPGYNTVIVKAARTDAAGRPGWLEVPFGMECDEAISQTAAQVASLPWPTLEVDPDSAFKRIVAPVGSGMSLAGVLVGLRALRRDTPVLGVCVGADPVSRLDRYAPPDWRDRCELVQSPLDYHKRAPLTRIGDVDLDPIYEAKCLPFLRPGDLLWIVGIRAA